jgi:TonB family protein
MRIVLYLAVFFLSFGGVLHAQKSNNDAVLKVVLRSSSGGTTTVNGKIVPNHKGVSEYFVTYPHPGYPVEARKLHATGNGIFRILLNRQGKVTGVAVQVSTGFVILDDESVRTIWSWQGKPGPLRQIDVPIWYQLSVRP